MPGGQRRRGAEAGQVDGDDVAFLGEQVDDRLPRLPAVADAVHQEQGRAVTPPLEDDVHAPRVDLSYRPVTVITVTWNARPVRVRARRRRPSKSLGSRVIAPSPLEDLRLAGLAEVPAAGAVEVGLDEPGVGEAAAAAQRVPGRGGPTLPGVRRSAAGGVRRPAARPARRASPDRTGPAGGRTRKSVTSSGLAWLSAPSRSGAQVAVTVVSLTPSTRAR